MKFIAFKSAILGISAAAMLAGASTSAQAEEKYVTIGTGGQTGVYFSVGQSICKLVNRGQNEHGIKCTAPSTGGSVANLNAIANGEQDMGVAQSDVQYHAYTGDAPEQFPNGANKDLRAVFAARRRRASRPTRC
jgi:TRAP transporter TAXI family solute receptor